MNNNLNFIDLFDYKKNKINYSKVCFFANLKYLIYRFFRAIILLFGFFFLLKISLLTFLFLPFFIRKFSHEISRFFDKILYASEKKLIKKFINNDEIIIQKYGKSYINDGLLAFNLNDFYKESFNSADFLIFSCLMRFKFYYIYSFLPQKIQSFLREILIKIFLAKSKKNIKKFNNGKKNLLFVNSHYVNYCHFLTEMMPKLYFLKENLDKYNIILKKDEKSMPYIMPILKAFGVEESQLVFIEKNEILELESLDLVSNSLFKKDLLNEARRYVLDFYKDQFKTNLGEKLYFARKSTFRKIENEEEVAKLLNMHGFIEVSPEKYHIIQQMSIMQNAKTIFGINSTGIQGNMIFAINPLTIIEARNEEVYLYPTCSTDLLDIDLNYNILFCKKTNIFKNWHKSNIIVDIKKLTTLLEKFK